MLTAAAALRAQLEDIDESMAALESQMTSLRAQKERVLKDLKSIAYPILTLPNEITVEILHFASLMWRRYSIRPQPYDSLMRLASVCQTWRALTLSTCALWDEVTADCNIIPNAGQILAACLPRAGSLPLDLDIELPADDSSIISTLSLYGSQWRRVSLSSMDRYGTPNGIKLPIDRLPSTFPLLERLKLFNFNIPNLLVVLPHAQNLRCLELVLACSTEYAPVAPLSILLPHLHTFIYKEDTAAMVLRYLTLPALESLRLGHLSDAGVHAILSCVARSCSTIRTLELNYSTFSATYNCLRSLSTVRHLCLSCDWSNWSKDEEKQFFAAMISVGFLPALESLTFNECCWPGSAKKLAAVVSARWRGVKGTTKLISASLDFAEPDDDNVPTSYPDVLHKLIAKPLLSAVAVAERLYQATSLRDTPNAHHRARSNMIPSRRLQVWVAQWPRSLPPSMFLTDYLLIRRTLPLKPGMTSTRSRGRRAVTDAVDVSGESTSRIPSTLACGPKIVGLTRAAAVGAVEKFSGGVTVCFSSTLARRPRDCGPAESLLSSPPSTFLARCRLHPTKDSCFPGHSSRRLQTSGLSAPRPLWTLLGTHFFHKRQGDVGATCLVPVPFIVEITVVLYAMVTLRLRLANA
ncbi:hypothetical protein GGX14DRAFT_647949, partial [Mycena pura]